MWFYLLGVITAPLIIPVVKPVVRAAMKGSVLLTQEVKKLAEEVREEYEDVAAENRASSDGQ